MIPIDMLPPLKNPLPMPKLPKPPRMRNYLLKFRSVNRGQTSEFYLTVFASCAGEAGALGVAAEGPTGADFTYEVTELSVDSN